MVRGYPAKIVRPKGCVGSIPTASANIRFEDWEAEQMRDSDFHAATEELESTHQIERHRIVTLLREYSSRNPGVVWERSPIRGWMCKYHKRSTQWAKPLWIAFGLSTTTTSPLPFLGSWECSAHDLVAGYLARHPQVRAQYKADQTGEVNYYGVLLMAEKEHEAIIAPNC